MNDHQYKTEEIGVKDAAKPENLSAIVTFRIRPTTLRKLDSSIPASQTRSQLLRTVVANHSVVYVGQELVDSIVSCRKDIARAGNLLKMIARPLYDLQDDPMRAADEREMILDTLSSVQVAGEQLLSARVCLLHTLETLNEQLRELNRGDL